MEKVIGAIAARIKRRSESGVTTIEYAVMLVLVSLSVASFGPGLSDPVTGVFSRMSVSLAEDEGNRDDERHPNNPHDHPHEDDDDD